MLGQNAETEFRLFRAVQSAVGPLVSEQNARATKQWGEDIMRQMNDPSGYIESVTKPKERVNIIAEIRKKRLGVINGR